MLNLPNKEGKFIMDEEGVSHQTLANDYLIIIVLRKDESLKIDETLTHFFSCCRL